MPAARAELPPRGICLQIWGYYCIHPSLSLSLFLTLPSPRLPPSLSLSLPVVLQPLSLRCVSVFLTIVLDFYDIAFIFSSFVMSVSWGMEVVEVVMVMGSRLPLTRPSVVFIHRRGRQEGLGERDWLRSAEIDVRVFVQDLRRLSSNILHL